MANGQLITPAHLEAVLKCDTISDFHNRIKAKTALVPSGKNLKEIEQKEIAQKPAIKNNIEFKNFVRQKLRTEPPRPTKETKKQPIQKLNVNRAICSKPPILTGNVVTEKGNKIADVLNSKTTGEPKNPESSVMKRLAEIEHGRKGNEITYEKIEEMAKAMMAGSIKTSVIDKYGSIPNDPLETMRTMRLLRLRKKPLYNGVPIFAHFNEIKNFEQELVNHGIFF